jgi:hypothetical protein
MPTHQFAEGEIVKARPNFLAPRTPSDTRPFAWPFYYPARITSLFGEDGVLVEFLDHQASADALEQVITPWNREQGFSAKELHALDCACGACDPNESLRDPRALIDRLRADLDGLGAHRAEHTGRTLRNRRFPGSLHLLPASSLERGDFLLFPQQHVHAAREIRGDIRLSFCHGAYVTGPNTRHLAHRPAQSAPVCDPRSTSFDPRYTAAITSSGLTFLEQAALVCLADLGLAEPADNPADAFAEAGTGSGRDQLPALPGIRMRKARRQCPQHRRLPRAQQPKASTPPDRTDPCRTLRPLAPRYSNPPASRRDVPH